MQTIQNVEYKWGYGRVDLRQILVCEGIPEENVTTIDSSKLSLKQSTERSAKVQGNKRVDQLQERQDGVICQHFPGHKFVQDCTREPNTMSPLRPEAEKTGK